MWTVVFGAIYASKHHEHVSFSLIYDKFGPIGRSVIVIIGDIIILASFCLMYFPIIEYVIFIGIKTTPVLNVPFDIMYAPFVLFITFSGGYLIRDIIIAIKTFQTPKEILMGLEAYRKEILYFPNDQKAIMMTEKEAELRAAYAEKKGGE
jgi:TRAP-type C4-dicarboxylate transport system permease small subunit